jgi:hypothetical protein
MHRLWILYSFDDIQVIAISYISSIQMYIKRFLEYLVWWSDLRTAAHAKLSKMHVFELSRLFKADCCS